MTSRLALTSSCRITMVVFLFFDFYYYLVFRFAIIVLFWNFLFFLFTVYYFSCFYYVFFLLVFILSLKSIYRKQSLYLTFEVKAGLVYSALSRLRLVGIHLTGCCVVVVSIHSILLGPTWWEYTWHVVVWACNYTE